MRCGTCGTGHRTWYDRTVRRVRDLPCGDLRISLEFEVRRVCCRQCGGVKRERLDWFAANPHYTKRFALYVGKHCRSASIKEVPTDLHLERTVGDQVVKASVDPSTRDSTMTLNSGTIYACQSIRGTTAMREH